MNLLFFPVSVFIDFYFLNRMLTPRFRPLPTFFILAAIDALVSYINVNLGLYLVFPQEIFFLLSAISAIHLLYTGSSGKRLMISIFTDGMCNISAFLFVPLFHYFIGSANRPLPIDSLYHLCDLSHMAFIGIVYLWIARKYRNLQGTIAPQGNFYLLILTFFIESAVTYYGTSQLDSRNYSLPSAIFITLSAVCGVLILLFSLYYVDRRLFLALARQQNEFLEKQMEVWKENEKQAAAFRHDLKNHFICLEGLLHSGHTREAETYLNAITHTVSAFSSEFSTGNVYADAVLREKLALAESGNIILETDMIFPPAEEFPPMELCIILSNGLDNAIEALKRLPGNRPDRKIKALSYVRHSCLMIEISNPLPLSQKHGPRLLKSAKQDPGLHGIGLSNIRQAVDCLHGTMEIATQNDRFCLCVMLPLKAAVLQTEKL